MQREFEFCLRCGRKLKNPDARLKGYGIVCEKKMQIKQENRLFTPKSLKKVVDN